MYYFAYGADINKKQMLPRCPRCRPRCSAVLPNYQLVFTGWSRQWRGGMATIRRASGGKVPGAVYEVSEQDMKIIDGYEGYPGTASRLNVTVYNEDDEAIQAFTYIKTGNLEETAPSREYLAVIQQGYREWGIT